MVKSGLVVRSYSGYYYVDCDGVMITCKVKGHMKQKRFSLCTGDRVQLEPVPDKAADEGMITSVLPRKNYLERPTVANLDLLVITLALAQPDFSFLIMDKLLVLAEAARIPVLLVRFTGIAGMRPLSYLQRPVWESIRCGSAWQEK